MCVFHRNQKDVCKKADVSNVYSLVDSYSSSAVIGFRRCAEKAFSRD